MGLTTFLIFALVCVGAGLGASNQIPSVEIQAGFEFIGNADGKTLIRPILTESSKVMYYQDAIALCVSAGYRIATIETQAQSDLLKPIICGSSSYGWAWIDGVDFQKPYNFFSINSGQNLTFFDWFPGQPYTSRTANICLRYSCTNASVKQSGFYDVPCTDWNWSVICQA